MPSAPLRRRGAFTLLELLVVAAVIAALAGLLLPTLAAARDRARQTACLANLHQLSTAHRLYVQDWDESLPHWVMPAPRRPGSPDSARFWPIYLAPYLRAHAPYRDPAAGSSTTAAPGSARLADYVLLTWQADGDRDEPTNPVVRWPGPPLTLCQVVRPSETIQWMDGWTATYRAQGEVRRHGSGLNVAFVDGHIRWMAEKSFWRVEWDRRGFYWLYHGCADR